MEEVAEHVWNAAGLELDVYIYGEGTAGVVVYVPPLAVILEYPFALDELLSMARDLECLALCDYALEELANQIAEIDGIYVSISVDEGADAARVDGRQRREQLIRSTGATVQFPTPYPYQRAMNGERTVRDWIDVRFSTHYYGLSVRVRGAAKSTRLAEVRRRHHLKRGGPRPRPRPGR